MPGSNLFSTTVVSVDVDMAPTLALGSIFTLALFLLVAHLPSIALCLLGRNLAGPIHLSGVPRFSLAEVNRREPDRWDPYGPARE